MKFSVKKICIMAVLLAIGYVLPFLTSNLPTIGRVFNPMHYPVFICGFILGPVYGAILGIILPLTRSFIFLAPVFPYSLSMALELAAYGFISGLFIKIIKTKNLYVNILLTLLISMLIGRLVWGLGRGLLSLIIKDGFNIKMFVDIGFITAWPGILIQILILPPLIRVLYKPR